MIGKEIHPINDDLLSRNDREIRLNQRSIAIWLTGLSGSGKSTLAISLEKRLFQEGFFCQVLDGDNIRNGINKNLSFSDSDREENIRRIAEITKLYVNTGIITINSFISPSIKSRQYAKDIIGENDFLEIYVSTPLEECERRDIKGLYAKARKGIIKNFTGISSSYEAPENPFINIDTTNKSISDSVELIYTEIKQKITL